MLKAIETYQDGESNMVITHDLDSYKKLYTIFNQELSMSKSGKYVIKEDGYIVATVEFEEL